MERLKQSTCASSVLLFSLDSGDGYFKEAAEERLDEEQILLCGALLAPYSSFENMLSKDVQNIQESVLKEDGRVDIVVLACRLAVIGYKVAIRTALGGGTGQNCFRNLNYEFLLVSPQYGSETSDIIVDSKFREQFGLSQQTSRYTHLLSLLPNIYVGRPSRLPPLVKLLTCEMEAAFSQTGITIPPWRQAGSMLSKWKPQKSRDIEVNSPTCGVSPRGALDLCSSRASSWSGSDISSDDMCHSFSGLRRKENTPRKIQSGFCVKLSHATVPEPAVSSNLERADKGQCMQYALLSGNASLTKKLGGFEQSKGARQDEGDGLAKIRTVKLRGNR